MDDLGLYLGGLGGLLGVAAAVCAAVASLLAAVAPVALILFFMKRAKASAGAWAPAAATPDELPPAGGVPGEAKITHLKDLNMLVNGRSRVQLTLEVRPESAGAVTVVKDLAVGDVLLSRLQPGAVVPVVVDPRQPSRLAIDWTSMGYST